MRKLTGAAFVLMNGIMRATKEPIEDPTPALGQTYRNLSIQRLTTGQPCRARP